MTVDNLEQKNVECEKHRDYKTDAPKHVFSVHIILTGFLYNKRAPMPRNAAN
jgi:hypothetical protein